MAVVLASGTLDGAGLVSGAVVRLVNVLGSFGGGDGLTGDPLQTVIVGGQTHGSGSVLDLLSLDAAGVVTGAGSLSGTPLCVLWGHALPMVGAGSLGDHFPLPMVGQGNLLGFYLVERIPERPVPLKTFRWMQRLGIGDLEMRPTDATGMPYSPIVVLYSLYQVLPGGAKMLVGAPNRRPAQQGVGYYYATGTAGEFGQPGEWAIEWRCQRFWYEPPQVCEKRFIVQDAFLAGLPGHDGRACKKGWL